MCVFLPKQQLFYAEADPGCCIVHSDQKLVQLLASKGQQRRNSEHNQSIFYSLKKAYFVGYLKVILCGYQEMSDLVSCSK